MASPKNIVEKELRKERLWTSSECDHWSLLLKSFLVKVTTKELNFEVSIIICTDVGNGILVEIVSDEDN